MTTEAMQTALLGLVSLWSGLPPNRVVLGLGGYRVLDSAQSSDPTSPFAVGFPSSDDKVSRARRNRNAANGLTEEVGRTYWRTRFDVQFFRKGSGAAARKFVSRADTDTGAMDATRAGIRVETGKLRDVAQIVSDAWEERYSVEVDVLWEEDGRIDTGVVQTIPFAIGTPGQPLPANEADFPTITR